MWQSGSNSHAPPGTGDTSANVTFTCDNPPQNKRIVSGVDIAITYPNGGLSNSDTWCVKKRYGPSCSSQIQAGQKGGSSPLGTGPTPGRTNSVQRPAPLPIVVGFIAVQAVDGAALVRTNQPARIEATFSSTNGISGPLVEYFVDDINVTNETWSTVPLSPVVTPSDGRYTAVLPGRPSRSIVRYRIRANRGRGQMTVWLARTAEVATPRPARTLARRAKATSSFTADLDALSDQLEPKSSIDNTAPYVHWWPKKGTTEWAASPTRRTLSL